MDNQELYMQRCFDLARLAGKAVKSNPQVGAVIVHNDTIIGEGYHKKFGGPHAEINALNSVGEADKKLLNESTLLISLEPCCIDRKTPPCTNAIVESGIKKVIFSVKDPNPEVAGKSIKILEDHGITVSHGLLEKEGMKLIKPFKANLEDRPYVILKWAQSSDAYIGKRGKTISISNDYSKIMSHRWRSEVDAILIGYQTALVDDPQLNTRLWDGEDPLRVVLDPKGELPDNLHIYSDERPTLFINDKSNGKELLANKEIVAISSENDDFIEQLLLTLYRKGINKLIVEGGTKTLYKFIDKNLWNEARIITNNQPLKSGIKAPYITGIPYGSYQIIDDEITYVYPKSTILV